MPWRAAFALQRSGWILRNAVVWAKPNPMPDSVRDRLSATYELLFLLTKSPKYFFTLDPIRVPLARRDAADGTQIIGGSHKGRTGGVDATRRRRGTSRYGANKHTGELAAGAGRATCARSGTPTPPLTRPGADRRPPLDMRHPSPRLLWKGSLAMTIPDHPTHPSQRHPNDTAWTVERIRALGLVTDIATAAEIFELSRSAAYDLAKRDQFPVAVLKFGTRYRVPVAAILQALHLPATNDGPSDLLPPVAT